MVGNLFVSTDTGKVIGIEPGSGTQTLFASGFTQPTGMDFRPAKFGGDTDRVGFLYVADTATGTISQISIAGEVTPFVHRRGNAQLHGFPNCRRDAIARRSYRSCFRYC